MIAYEVLRIINSKPLFAISHYERMFNSIKSFCINTDLSYEEFISTIKNVILSSGMTEGNVKIESNDIDGSEVLELKAKVLPHHYPSSYDYKNGVATTTFLHIRENPNSKIWNQSLRERIDEMISLQNVYEVIYINSSNNITEGSRSNIFFIEDNILISALPEDVLRGITRKYIIDLAIKNGMEFVEKNINLSDIENYDAAFISGTSPKILPICNINEINFGTNSKFMRILMKEFDVLIDNEIKNFSFEKHI